MIASYTHSVTKLVNDKVLEEAGFPRLVSFTKSADLRLFEWQFLIWEWYVLVQCLDYDSVWVQAIIWLSIYLNALEGSNY